MKCVVLRTPVVILNSLLRKIRTKQQHPEVWYRFRGRLYADDVCTVVTALNGTESKWLWTWSV